MQVDPIFEWFEFFEFFLIAGVVIFLAYVALEHKNIVYAAFSFGLMAAAVAGFFLLLEAPFMAGMQIAVYTGGISVLIIFAVLLLPRAQDETLEEFATPRQRYIGIIVSAIFVAYAGLIAFLFPWAETFPEESIDIAQNLEMLAQWLWGEHGIYVQIIALIMITALVGSIAILRMEKAERFKPIVAEFGIEVEDLSTDEDDVEPEPESPPEATEEGENE